MLAKIWTTLCLSAAAVCTVGWFVALMHEHGIRPACSLAGFFRKQSKAGRIVLAAFFLGFWIYAANKPGGGSGSGGSSGDDAGGTNTEETVGMVLGDAGTNDTMSAAFGLPLNIAGLGCLSLVESGDMPVTLSMGEETAFGPVASTNAARQLADEDFRRGFVLTRTGTGESFDFSAPSNADVCADWRAFGAAQDWVYAAFTNGTFRLGTNDVDRFRIFSFGRADALVTNETGRILTGNWLAPFRASLGIVPEANWNLLDCNAASNSAYRSPSQFWSSTTPSNTLRLTWQNVLLNRETNSPVSFQAELWPSGKFLYRYDLSRLDADAVSNILVGASCGGSAWTTNALATNVTSLAFHPLTAEDEADPDRDGDGVPTVDELFVYGTDPDNADTDFDGLSDSDELFVYNTSPLDPHSRSAALCDGFAVKIGDVDPFSCPEGSTNTVLEHVFYSGTTNGVFAYPQSSGSSAVLRVSVSGAGSGELVVGSTVVPLVAPTSDAPALASTEGGTGSFGTPLLVQVARDEDVRLYLRGDSTLSVALDSDDFAFGTLPSLSGGSVIGFVNFPNTVAETPCIHDFNARRKSISLPVASGAEALCCTWTGSDDVEVENAPPRSAVVTGSFNARSTSGITYTLSHPLYLFGRTTYAQTVRFCPRPSDADPDDPDAEDPPWFAGGDGDDSGSNSTEREERWCCFWGTCCDGDGSCFCGCEDESCCQQDEDGWSEDEEPLETCPLHHVSYEQCASLHYDAYTNATWQVEEYRDILKIRDPLDYDQIHLPCPGSYRKCCDCPDHCTNYVAVAYKSYRLSLVDENGNAFTRAVDPCTVRVAGVHPSSSVGDAALGFVTNGVVFRTYGYTVLGVGFSKPDGPSLSVYNNLSRTMGVPMTVTTNVNHALRLDLLTNVGLPSGDMQFSIDAEEGSQFTVWTYDYWLGRYRRLLDTDGRSVVNLPISRWRRLVGRSSESYSRATPIFVTSAAKGSATLRIGYWCIVDGKVVQDWQSQVVTSVDPPLLPDYNRDGRVDGVDVDAHMRGQSFWYWQNQDMLRGEFIPDGGCGNALNTGDNVVNGSLDLVNFFPVALRVSELVDHWGAAVSCYIEPDAGGDAFKFCFADVPWSDVGSVQTNDVRTVDGQRLNCADLVALPADGWRIPWGTLGGFSENSGVLVAEAVRPDASLRLTFRVGDEVLYSYALPMTIVPVREMYRFYNLRGAEAADYGGFILPWYEGAYAPPGEKDLDIFFTHGFNVSYDDARMWGDVLFKRFWLSGSRARFTMVAWAGDYHWLGDWANGLHYQQDAYQAQMAGDALKRLVEREQPASAKRILMTQSLGNMVACEALREGLNVSKYFMFDAAVASEAIDGSLQATNSTEAAFLSYVPSEWRTYPPLSWSANWFRWFNHGADDARGHMGWPDRFAAALDNAGEVYNYYSTGDEVFHATASPPWLFEGMGESTANYCWQKQETLKGSRLPAGTAYGGWGFHMMLGDVFYSSAAAADAVASGSVTNAPVFNRGYSPMFSRDASQEEVFMALAKYVPAVSSAVGGKAVLDNVENNVNMNDPVRGVPRPNGWGRPSEDDIAPWKHSDMKDLAFYYVYELFKQLKEKGNLQ